MTSPLDEGGSTSEIVTTEDFGRPDQISDAYESGVPEDLKITDDVPISAPYAVSKESSLRLVLFYTLTYPRYSKLASAIYYIVIFFIVLSLGCFCAESVLSLGDYSLLFFLLETLAVAVLSTGKSPFETFLRPVAAAYCWM
jgi:hypothetical protein